VLVRHMISDCSPSRLRETMAIQIRRPIDVKPRLAPVEAIAQPILASRYAARNRKTDGPPPNGA